MDLLKDKKCVPCEGGVAALHKETAQKLLVELNQWQLNEVGNEIYKEFKFKNFYQTIGFINAVAWIANSENHHPDIAAGYNYCNIRYSTHAIHGLSENDFICAAKIDALLK